MKITLSQRQKDMISILLRSETAVGCNCQHFERNDTLIRSEKQYQPYLWG